MNELSIIRNSSSGEVFGFVVISPESVKALPVSSSASEWAEWITDSGASFEDVKTCLDGDLQHELPAKIDRSTVSLVRKSLGDSFADQLLDFADDKELFQFGESHKTMGTRYMAKSVRYGVAPQKLLFAEPLSHISNADRQRAIEFKAARFRNEQKVTNYNLQVKRVRAVFDANIGSGGGWRCPDGTMYGGQITDRFGRGCGGGLTRRIGRALMRAGRRLDDAGQGRDSRRLARRARAQDRRDQRGDRARQAVGRAAVGLEVAAQRLVGDYEPGRPVRDRERERRAPSPARAQDRQPRRQPSRQPERQPAAERRPFVPGQDSGERADLSDIRSMTDEELDAVIAENDRPQPFDGNVTRGRILRERAEAAQREKRRRARGGVPDPKPTAEDRAQGGREEQRPARRPGRRPSAQERFVEPREQEDDDSRDDPFDFIEDPETREMVREALGEYADEVAELIRNRRRGQRRRTGPDRDGGERQPGGRPSGGRRAPEGGRSPEGGAGSGGDEADGDQRTLRQRIMDALVRALRRVFGTREQRQERRERRQNRAAERRSRLVVGLENAAQRILQEEGVADRPRRQRRNERDSADRDRVNESATRAAERIFPETEEEQRDVTPEADGQPSPSPARPRRPRRPRQPRPATQDENLEGSLPDERSLRNVRNRFPRRGLPQRANWRNRNARNYDEANEREMDRRFGRYYDEDGRLNARGRYVNARLAEERQKAKNENRELTQDNIDEIVNDADNSFIEPPAPPASSSSPTTSPSGRRTDPDGRPSVDQPRETSGTRVSTTSRRVPRSRTAGRQDNQPVDWREEMDQKFLDELSDSGENGLASKLNNFNEEILNSSSADTPPALNRMVEEFNRASRQYQLGLARLEAMRRGDLPDDPEERERIRSAMARSRDIFAQVFGEDKVVNRNFDIDFGSPNSPDVVNAGIMHPSVDDNMRNAYVRAFFSVPAGFNDLASNQNRRQALKDLLDFDNAINSENQNANYDFDNLANMSPDGREDLMARLAFRQQDINRRSENMVRATNMNINEARNILRLRDHVDALQNRISEHKQKFLNADGDRIFPDNVDAIDLMARDVRDYLQDLDFIHSNFGRLNSQAQIYLNNGDANDLFAFDADIGDMRIAADAANVPSKERIRNVFVNISSAFEGTGVGDDAALKRARILGALKNPTDRERMYRDIASAIYPNAPQAQLADANTEVKLAFEKFGLNDLMGSPNWNASINDGIALLRSQRGEDFVNANVVANQMADAVVDSIPNDVGQPPDPLTGTRAAALIDGIVDQAKQTRRRRFYDWVGNRYPNLATGATPWGQYRRENGNHPIDASNLLQDIDRFQTDPAYRQQVTDWFENIYNVEIDSGQGTKMRVVVGNVSGSGSDFDVDGNIEGVKPDGTTFNVGTFRRIIKSDGSVESYLFWMNSDHDLVSGKKIRRAPNGGLIYVNDGSPVPEGVPTAKGSGLATISNNHSWGWLKDAGFKKVTVGAAQDGQYVWGRVGYRRPHSFLNRDDWNNINAEIESFQNGRPSIVENEAQAALLRSLKERADAVNNDPRQAPGHFEMIYALEHASQNPNRSNDVRDWILSKVPMGGGQIFLDDMSFDPVRVYGDHLLQGMVRPQAPAPQVGSIASPVLNPGELPTPRVIENSRITNGTEAANFVSNGGSLGEVPNEFWLDALSNNSSMSPNDQNSVFFEVRPNGGNVAETRIFFLRDQNGNPTNQGWVLKGSNAQASRYDDAYAEVVGYNIAAALGLMPTGAGYIGQRNGKNYIAVPLAHGNAADNRELITPSGAANYDPDLWDMVPDKALPQRMAHLMHNYLLGGGDRHYQNGGGFMDQNGNPIIVPFDHGRIAVSEVWSGYPYLEPDASIETYVDGFDMDVGILNDLRSYSASLTGKARDDFRDQVIGQYDEMISRMNSIVSIGRDEFISRMLNGSTGGSGARERLGGIFDHINTKLGNSSATRTSILRRLT